MSQLRRRNQELQSLGVQVAVVTFQHHDMARAYAQQTELPWPILADPERTLYRAYGMERGRRWDVYGPAALWSYVNLLARGRMPRAAAGDPRQLGGDVLIDPNGVVRWRHVGRGPADRPSVDALLAIIRAQR